MRLTLHIFVLISFILSGISPACAFISGKSSIEIEICTNDGIKTVTLPGDAPEQQEHEKKNDCAFCFAQTHLKTAKADAVLISYVPKIFDEQSTAFKTAAVHRFELASLSARAPPLL
ncbi:MAG: hypothetical protein DYH13_02755 [Alphaproteobacteria bacterium PRO2]|nr:hypothetical protein [Alphaproteobacteria bacterium PRO2]